MSEQPVTQETPRVPGKQGLKPPPRILLWAVIGLFLLGILGMVGAVVAFRSVLLPAQQQRVIDELPFMRAFMPPTPEGGTLPTAIPVDSDISPEDLLAAPLGIPTTVESTPEATTVPTEAAALIEVVASPTVTQTPSPTLVASVTPTDSPTVAPTAETADVIQSASASQALPISARMFGFSFSLQTWNNCGPANLTMALSYYGWTRGQSYAAQILKPDREDKNVNPAEMVQFVNDESQLRAISRMGGDLDMLKAFVAAQIPIIIETGYMPEGYDWIGHYQTVVAYDDLQDSFYLYDTYLGDGENGEGLQESFAELDENWRHFNRTFIVIYEPNREAEVRQILGERADPNQAAAMALERARQEAQANMRDAFAWFNIGTSLTKLGLYEDAAAAYDQARREGVLPWRMTWYQFGPFEAYYNVGRFDDVLALVNVNLTNTEYVEETYYWQGLVFEAQGNISGARTAFNRALQHNYRYAAARTALEAL